MWRRNKDARKLPGYFRQDQVGGLSDLLIRASRSGAMCDLKSYGDSLEARFGYDYAAISMIGIAVLSTPDKKKLSTLDELVPESPPRDELESQQLLSVVIHAACEPVLKHTDLAQMLLPGDRVRRRAISYISAFIDECKEISDGWWVSTGNTPIRPSSSDQVRFKGINRLIQEFWRLMNEALEASLFESTDPIEVQKKLLDFESKLAAAKGTVDAMQRIWPDGQNIFDRFLLAISELLSRRSLVEEFSDLINEEPPPSDLSHRHLEIMSKNREVLMIVSTYLSEASEILTDLTGIRLD